MQVRYCHYNNGASFRTVGPDYQATDGEVVFDQPDPATPDQLAASFPGYADQAGADAAKLQIAQLERQQTPRRMREAALGVDGGWLKDIETKIAALRGKV